MFVFFGVLLANDYLCSWIFKLTPRRCLVQARNGLTRRRLSGLGLARDHRDMYNTQNTTIMAEMNFGGVIETVVTSKEFSLEKAREVLKDEVIAVIGYGIQGPGQACNLRDNGFNVIVGQRQGKTYDKAVADGWVPGKTLFSIEEAAEKGTILCMLLSDAGQIQVWPTLKQYLKPGKTLYYSHGFAINWSDRTGVVPPKDVDVIMVAPKGSGTSLRTMFCEGRGLNCSYAVYQDASGKAKEKTLAFGIGIGAGYMF